MAEVQKVADVFHFPLN